MIVDQKDLRRLRLAVPLYMRGEAWLRLPPNLCGRVRSWLPAGLADALVEDPLLDWTHNARALKE